jgi:hypothetical protein
MAPRRRRRLRPRLRRAIAYSRNLELHRFEVILRAIYELQSSGGNVTPVELDAAYPGRFRLGTLRTACKRMSKKGMLVRSPRRSYFTRDFPYRVPNVNEDRKEGAA